MLTKRAVSWSVCASLYVCDSSHSTEWCLWCFAIWSILNGITGKWCGLLSDTDSLQSCASVFSEWNSSIMLLSTNSQPYVGKIREVTMLLRNQTHTVCCSTSHLSWDVEQQTTTPRQTFLMNKTTVKLWQAEPINFTAGNKPVYLCSSVKTNPKHPLRLLHMETQQETK